MSEEHPLTELRVLLGTSKALCWESLCYGLEFYLEVPPDFPVEGLKSVTCLSSGWFLSETFLLWACSLGNLDTKMCLTQAFLI